MSRIPGYSIPMEPIRTDNFPVGLLFGEIAPHAGLEARPPFTATPSRRSSPILPEQLLVPAEPSPFPPRIAGKHVDPTAKQLAANPLQDEPGRLAGLDPQQIAHPVAATERQANRSGSRFGGFLEHAPVYACQPETLQGQAQSWDPPAQTWEQITRLHDACTARNVPETSRSAESASQSEPEEIHSRRASRFDGLRNLVAVPELRKMRIVARG